MKESRICWGYRTGSGDDTYPEVSQLVLSEKKTKKERKEILDNKQNLASQNIKSFAKEQIKQSNKTEKHQDSIEVCEKFLKAVIDGNLDEVSRMVYDGVNIDYTDEYGSTALIYASAFGNYDIVKFLVKNNAKIDIIDNMEMSAFDYAVEKHYVEIQNFLKRYQKDTTDEIAMNEVNSENYSGLNIDISSFYKIFDGNYVTNSYKFYWLHSILEVIKSGKSKILFRELVLKMLVKAWQTSIVQNIKISSTDPLYKVIEYIRNNFYIPNNLSEHELYIVFLGINDNKFNVMIIQLFKFVPYRLLIPFYSEELAGIEDHQINSEIFRLIQEDENAFYKINVIHIIINDNWALYILNNYDSIERWIQDKLNAFLKNIG